ncbi:MAG: DUF420 domain-containing protein [Sulfurovum sp.]|nr:MAG: DUF420 domain-containing protein [Sulfurovum sp.]
MEYMYQSGFLGTKAPIFMDIVTLIVAILPMLVYGAIRFVRKGEYRIHGVLNTVIFFITILAVAYFEYGVRIGGGYASFSQNSHVAHSYLISVLGLHIAIAVMTLALWANVLYGATKTYEKGLPGPYSKRHTRMGKITFIGIVLTSLTGIWLYLLLFVY